MAYNTPNVGNGALSGQSSTTIAVGSPQWFEWLEGATNRSFYFKEGFDSFTARKEQRQGKWYWYAYRRIDGKLHSAYIGKSDELDQGRLAQIARSLLKETASDGLKISQKSAKPRLLPVSNSLLDTKLHIPPARARAVNRNRLTQHLDRLHEPGSGRLVLITAPAGFGKTTLLSEWLSRNRFKAAWLSLESDDDEPGRFWNYLVAALNTLLGELGDGENLPPYVSATNTLEPFLTGLINRLAALETECLLVLDDYHLIRHEAILKGMVFLLDHLPPPLHLALLSRNLPDLPLARLRARNQLIEIEAAAMRFNQSETATFLSGVMGLNLDESAVVALEERTEGWVAGLQLAGLSLLGREADHIPTFLDKLNHTHRFVVDYLAEEVLSLQPPIVQTFLMETSILENLNASLAQAVTGRDDCQQLLQNLERSNLFLTPLDGTGQWYRYHQLFAEFLADHLQRTQPDCPPLLHRRAAAWYEQHARIGEAVRHYVAGGESGRAADLLELHSERMLMQGENAVLVSWLAFLPPELLKNRPQLTVHLAWALMITDQFERVAELTTQAERAIGVNLSEDITFQPLAPEPGQRRAKTQNILAEILAIRASVASSQRDVARTIELARQALELLPQRHRLRGVVNIDLGYALFLNGNLRGATEAFGEAAQVGQSTGDVSTHIVAASQLAVLHVRQGQLHQAARLYHQILRVATDQDGQPMPNADTIYLNLAMLMYEWNDLKKCIEYLLKSLEISQLSRNIEIQIEIYVLLARVRQAEGRPEEIGALWQKIDELLHTYPIPWYINSVQGRRARLALVQGDLATASTWAEETGISINDELTLLNKRTVEYIVFASLLIAQRRVGSAHILLGRLLEAAQAGGYMSREIWIIALQALAYHAQGRSELALATLETTLKLAEPEGYVRVFADESLTMRALFAHFQEVYGPITGVSPGYLAKLAQSLGLAAPAEPSGSPPDSDWPVESLSKRELQVLRLLATNKSNATIAQELSLTVGTVKIHAKNIYKKLDVHSRRQAVARARALNLL